MTVFGWDFYGTINNNSPQNILEVITIFSWNQLYWLYTGKGSRHRLYYGLVNKL